MIKQKLFRSPALYVKLFYFLVQLVFFTNSLSAETVAIFGFKAGYSLSKQYGITDKNAPYKVESYFKNGFNVGVIVSFPITESFNIKQEFLIVTKGSSEDITMNSYPIKTHTEYNMYYFELPFLLRYSFVKFENINIYGSSGFALSILLGGNSKLDGTIEMNGTQVPFFESTKLEDVDIFDYGFCYGAGLDFNLFNKNCFFEFSFTIGWNTLLMPTAAGQEPAPLRNQNYSFSFGIYL